MPIIGESFVVYKIGNTVVTAAWFSWYFWAVTTVGYPYAKQDVVSFEKLHCVLLESQMFIGGFQGPINGIRS